MSSKLAIKVENLSKCYSIYSNPADRLKQMLASKKNSKKYYQEFWALKNISFEIKKGSTVGVVGKNGSGKSTLLQLICGVLNPTSGNIYVKGRIAALLELGAGFNPDFTGKENIYLNATILGLTSHEIDVAFIQIISFADIGEFIDRPVNTYSSGMVVRLAFAIAIHANPEILIVDEALSVGDELFQRKCFSRIEEIKRRGATILFVSHSASSIVDLCDSAILIDEGELILSGNPKFVVSNYQKLLYAPSSQKDATRQNLKLFSDIDFLGETENKSNKEDFFLEVFDENFIASSTLDYDCHDVSIQHVKLLNAASKQVNTLIPGRRYTYCYEVIFNVSAKNVRFGLMIKSVIGNELAGASSARDQKFSLPEVIKGKVYKIEFDFDCLFNEGTYFMNAGVLGQIDTEETYLARKIDAYAFRVARDESGIILKTASVNPNFTNRIGLL
jgi:lipopolysaccharide transport system ATP-binding protein